MIKSKEIINEDKKYCKICGKPYYNDGIILINSAICQRCMEEITAIDCNDLKYENIKDKIKNLLQYNIKNLKWRNQ